MMTFEELKTYIETGNEIEFTFAGKKYSITYWYPDGSEDNVWISFCEFYKDTTEVRTAEELWNDVSRDGITVGEMLSSVTEDDVYIF